MIDIILSTSHFAVIAICGFLFWRSHRNLKRNEQVLAEMRQCNNEFSEAIALLQYGAVDEAIELSQKWHERAEGWK